MAINQNDYNYWNGSFTGLLPNEILKLSDEDFQTLYKEFIKAKIDPDYLKYYIEQRREDFEDNQEYLEGRVLKQCFKRFLRDITSDYLNYFDTEKEINIFRSLSVNEIEEISFDDKGVCWTYNLEALYNYIEDVIVPHNQYLTRFYGTTPIDNIDWIESFFLYINFNTLEKELRVYDSQKIFLKGYVNIDYSTMMEYSKGGETSYLLRGVIIKEDILKGKELLYNPQTNRYDYDGNLDRSIVNALVSESRDGFTINFGKVTGNFDCSRLSLKSLKGAPQEVGGGFDCSNNKLISLKGAPQEVGESFNCSGNQLTSLEGAPQEVGESFDCSFNQLTSLEGAPTEVDGSFNCYENQLTSLKGAPIEVGKHFICSNNKLSSLEGAPQKVDGDFSCFSNQLTSLEGAPKEVGGGFYCKNNKFTSLEGAPQTVSGDFICYQNQLTSLKGAPKEVGGTFDCSINKLTTLEGAPKKVGGDFNCYNNQLTSLEGAPKEVGGNIGYGAFSPEFLDFLDNLRKQ